MGLSLQAQMTIVAIESDNKIVSEDNFCWITVSKRLSVVKGKRGLIFSLTNPFLYDSIDSIERKREDILRIISESPLSIYLSEKEKMDIIDRILSNWEDSATSQKPDKAGTNHDNKD